MDNPFVPFPGGRRLILEGEDEEEGEQIRVEITVLDATEVVAGVTTRVVGERAFINDEIFKVFARGVGLMADEDLELISF